jgi:hypothetical protein
MFQQAKGGLIRIPAIISLSNHPELPMPFTNGAEPPSDSLRDLGEPHRIATIRHEKGIRQFSSLISYWLTYSGLSLHQLATIASWGLNDQGLLEKSALSRLRTGKKNHGASWKQVDAFSAANNAIWLWQVEGQQAAWKTLGQHDGWGVRDKWLNQAIWLPRRDNPCKPLNFTDMANLRAGYIELPYLGPVDLTASDLCNASAALPDFLDRISVEQQWGPSQAIEAFQKAYPPSDTGSQRRLRLVITGEKLLSPDELESALHDLAEMVRLVRKLQPGSYGSAQLWEELTSSGKQQP